MRAERAAGSPGDHRADALLLGTECSEVCCYGPFPRPHANPNRARATHFNPVTQFPQSKGRGRSAHTADVTAGARSSRVRRETSAEMSELSGSGQSSVLKVQNFLICLYILCLYVVICLCL